MAGRASQISLLGLLLAVALAATSLLVSLTALYMLPPEKMVTAICTETWTVTTTITHVTTVTTVKGEPTISLVSSGGRCGIIEKPSLTFEREGNNNVLLRYVEQAGVPCYRHAIVKSVILERWPPTVEITLSLEPTSDVCVECIGVIETALRVGPIPSGAEIYINGLRVVV